MRVLRSDEVSAIQEGNLRLDCLRMRLEQNGSENPRVFEGPGYVRFGPDQQIAFKIYDVNASPDTPEEFNKLAGRADRFIPKEERFSFSAIDLKKQRQWKAEDVFLSGGTQRFDAEGRTVSGDLWEVAASEAYEGDSYFQARVFDEDARVPTVCRPCPSKIGACKLEKSDGVVSFEVSGGATALPQRIAERAREALRFVLARPLSWDIEERGSEGVARARIYSRHLPQVDTRMAPPVGLDWADTNDWFWRLFDKYLQHLLKDTGDKFHGLSSVLNLIYRASDGYIQSEALALCTGVEAILKSEPALHGLSATDEDKAAWREAHSYLKREDVPEELKGVRDKLLSFAGSQSGSQANSARDHLDRAEAHGIVTQRQRAAWGALRNQVAHGQDPLREDLSIQDLIRKCDCLVMLIYRLIFYVVGYTGKYTDQSTDGWPIKTFDP